MLNELAIKYGTDKLHHGYIKHYEEYLKDYKEFNIHTTLLEFGVHTGASLQMWAEYLPYCIIYGVDDGSSGDLKREYPLHPNIRFREGSQINKAFLQSLIEERKYFDIIIDDGSHYSQDIIFTCNNMWEALMPGGYYVIEDLHCSYPPYTTGELAPRFNRDNFTAVQFINELINRLHMNVNTTIESISIYKGITFIQKKYVDIETFL